MRLSARAGERDRNGLAVARAHDGLARLLRRLQQVEALALALLERQHDAAPEDLLLAQGEQLARGGVGQLHHAVRRGDEHRIGHAVEHAVQIALVDRRVAQMRAHALERLLELADDVPPPHLHRAAVIALTDPLGAPDQRRGGGLDAACGAPGEHGGRDAGAEGEGERGEQRHRVERAAPQHPAAHQERGKQHGGERAAGVLQLEIGGIHGPPILPPNGAGEAPGGGRRADPGLFNTPPRPS
jgi:hypothetical protein